MTITRDNNVAKGEQYLSILQNSVSSDLYVNFKGELKSIPKDAFLGGIQRLFVKIVYGSDDYIIAEKIGKIFEANQEHIATLNKGQYQLLTGATLVTARKLSPRAQQKIQNYLTTSDTQRKTVQQYLKDNASTSNKKLENASTPNNSPEAGASPDIFESVEF
ncbi:MAG: hypothetical protein V4494_06200 [Chlamydiota bacterium]